MGTIFAKLLQEHKWICHITSGEATSDMTYSRVLLQKLCKNCPHPEKPFSNSKTISQIKFPYRIEKLVKSQQEWPGGKTLCRSLVTFKGFFCPVVLLLLLCENDDFFTQYLFLNGKRCHLMTFSWWLESARARVRGKSNHKFGALWGTQSFSIWD